MDKCTQCRAGKRLGYTVVEPMSVITTHLSEQVKRHVDTLFTDGDTETILKRIEDNPPSRVAEVRAHVQHQTVTQVFRLLPEGSASANIINAIALFHSQRQLLGRARVSRASARLINGLYANTDGTLSTNEVEP